MEFLLVFEGSRRVVSVGDGCTVVQAIEQDIGKRYPEKHIAIAPIEEGQVQQSSSKDVYIVQRLTEKWGFVDVTDPSQVQPGDEVTLVKLARSSQDVDANPHQQASGIISKVAKPTKAEASILKKLFPSSSSLPQNVPAAFDPTKECVFADRKGKKKSARIKPSNINLILLSGKETSIPRGKHKKSLVEKGRVKKVEFSRQMTSQMVTNTILKAFAGQEDFGSLYTLLHQCQDGKLGTAEIEHPNGDEFVGEALKHRGNVYLKADSETHVISDDQGSDCDLPEITVTKKRKVSSTGITTRADCTQQAVEVITIPSDCVEAETNNQPPSESIEEWRQIRHEQDVAFAESLQADRQKARIKAAEERKQQELDDLREELQAKFVNRSGPVRVGFRLPNSDKLQHSFFPHDQPKVLYQFVFANGVTGPFLVVRTNPRSVIWPQSLMSLADLEVGMCTLIVEMADSAPDPLLCLCDTVPTVPTVTVPALPEGVVLHEMAEDPTAAVAILEKAEEDRVQFLESGDTTTGVSHVVSRNNIYASVLELFSSEAVVCAFPLRVRFEGEKAIDVGGVYRDMLSAFWEEAYRATFDGGCLLTPVLHPQMDLATLPILGRILSHGYLSSGFLPIRVAFPTLAALLLGPRGEIGDDVLIETFLQTVSPVEASLVKKALCTSSPAFGSGQQVRLTAILSRFGTRQLPTPCGLRQQIIQAARFEYLIKPSAALQAITSGIPPSHIPFWRQMSVKSFHSLYLALSASPEKVIELLIEPDDTDQNQERVLGYLNQYIGDMKREELRRFVRFTTGSSVCMSKPIEIRFNNLSGLARRPISHTCSCLLELPSSYVTFEDFAREFQAVLFSDEDSWKMDAI